MFQINKLQHTPMWPPESSSQSQNAHLHNTHCIQHLIVAHPLAHTSEPQLHISTKLSWLATFICISSTLNNNSSKTKPTNLNQITTQRHFKWPPKQYIAAIAIIVMIFNIVLLASLVNGTPLVGTATITRSSITLNDFKAATSSSKTQSTINIGLERKRRAATARLDRLWDDAVIPYEIDPAFSDERAALFRSAMRHWENYTCIKFVERNPDEHRNYIVFTDRSCGCCSFVGKRGNGAQAISIGKHCDKFGIVVHELGHVVGFWHEHTRPDRDQHVQIISKNIMAGQEYNFNKLTKDEVNSLGLAYDYDSILHYATNTFAKDTYLDTILPLHGHLNTEEAGHGNNAGVNTVVLPASATVAPPSPLLPVVTNVSSQIMLTNHNRTTTTITSTGGGPNLEKTSTVASKQSGTTNSSGPLMINDDSSVFKQLERDFKSMLLFEYENQKSSSTQKSFDRASPKMVLLDGSVVVSVESNRGGDNNQSSRPISIIRSRRESSSIDVDDGLHMLAMDNMLAKTRPEIGQRVRLSVGDIAQTNLLYRCPKCGRTIQQTSGLFHSPGYHLGQPSVEKQSNRLNLNEFDLEGQQQQTIQNGQEEREFCEWRLSVGHGERIMVNITDLDLAPPIVKRMGMPKSSSFNDLPQINDADSDQMLMMNCLFDYIEIRDGYTHRAPLIAKLCGHGTTLKDIIRPIVSTGNRLLITYRTSRSSIERRGFIAQHDTVCGGFIMLGTLSSSPYNLGHTISLAAQSNAPNTIHNEKIVPSLISTSGSSNQLPKITNSRVVVVTNGSSPSENEVLLSSQTNLRYNHLQTQQATTLILSNSTEGPIEGATRVSETVIVQPTQQTRQHLVSENNQKSTPFSWNQWPALNTTTLQSPNWPEHYRPSKECIWLIRADKDHQVSLKFDSFDLEPHDSCAYDYVEVRDGDSLSSDLIGRFCANRIPEQIVSTSETLTVKFVSDSDVNRGGFLASLQQELDQCKLGCSYRCSNDVLPYRCECPSGLELAPDGKNCVRTCGGKRNDSRGQISSPSFPDLYPVSTRCVWEIEAPLHHRITLNFTHFDLEGVNSQECDYDFVDIRSKIEDGKYVKNGMFCGPNQGLVVTSVANIMQIEFKSDNSIQKSGFIAQYSIDKDECAINNGGCQHVCSNTIGSYQCSCKNGFVLNENKHDCLEGHCTYTVLASEGTFHSPNFPNPYQPNKECAWVFSTAPGHRIMLVFDEFDLESHQECTYDHVAVFDGESIADPALGRFCGSRKPLKLLSSFNMLFLLFRSDGTNERRGFNATHMTVCGGRLQANLNQDDLIFSHPLFDRTTHYGRNTKCEWTIEANDNQRVRIEFKFFALESEVNCNYDQTIVYDGPDNESPQLARLCGTDITKEQSIITSKGRFMLIVFKSDDSINNRGFSLTYTAIETSDDEQVAITYQTGSEYTQSS